MKISHCCRYGRRRVVLPLMLICAILVSSAVRNDDAESGPPVVFETDTGLDDAVALDLAPQHPHLNVAGIVVTEGVAERREASAHLVRLLAHFNRGEVRRFAGSTTAPAEPALSFRTTGRNVLKAITH